MSIQTAKRHILAPPRYSVTGVRHIGLVIGLLILGVGAALVAVLGPLVTGVIRYHVSEGATAQIEGGDVAGLVLAAPLSLIAGFLVWRRHKAGPVLALGPAVYGLYMYSQLALGNDMLRYPGNSEQFFFLFLGLFVVAAGIVVTAWRVIDPDDSRITSRRLKRGFGWFALIIALFLAVGLHLPGLVDAWSDQPVGTEYLADPVVFWLVKFMDLGLVVPALVVAGIGLIRDTAWVEKAKYAAAGWIALLGSSVAGMAIVMQASADPAGTTVNTVAFGLFAAVGLVVAFMVYRPLFLVHRPTGHQPGDT